MIETNLEARCRAGCHSGCQAGCRVKSEKTLILQHFIFPDNHDNQKIKEK
jgi:hypothetical protein